MKLGKPPVLEAWIEFRFAVNEEMPPWDEALAASFLSHVSDGRYRPDAYIGRTEFTIENQEGRPNVTDAQVVLERVKAIDAQRQDRYLQLGRGLLICNLVRKQGAWPGFDDLKVESLRAYCQYCNFFKPKKISAAVVHYRNAFGIPWRSDGQVEIRDYLTLYPEVPEGTLGKVADFRLSCSLIDAGATGMLSFSVKRDRLPLSDGKDLDAGLRLRVDWNLTSESFDGIEAVAVEDWLTKAHVELEKAFRSGFTTKGWQLFAPEDEPIC